MQVSTSTVAVIRMEAPVAVESTAFAIRQREHAPLDNHLRQCYPSVRQEQRRWNRGRQIPDLNPPILGDAMEV
jgi:hypothetical protein